MWCLFMRTILVCFTAGALPAPAQCAAPQPRFLNNLVTELLTVSSFTDPAGEFVFENPRSGWLFISASSPSGAPDSVIDTRPDPLVWRTNPDTGAGECMLLLNSGRHTLRVKGARDLRLDVRAVPELMYCYYPTHPHIAAFGPYDWTYMARHVLPHVNVLVTRDEAPPAQFAQWLREGRRWVSNAGLPGLGATDAPDPAAVHETWAANPGVMRPEFSGLIVDEFGDFPGAHFESWTEAVKRLHAMPQFAGKTYYAWCDNLSSHEPAHTFCRTLMDFGDVFTWEVYFWERPTVEEAREKVFQNWTADMRAWTRTFPGIEKRLVMCLGYLSAPPETINVNPQVDYQVFLDMQFRVLATDPAFTGLYGIMEYMADYADEESLRFAHRLFRHYAIEGKTEPFSTDPYRLPHLENPDFTAGLDAWLVDAAGPETVRADTMKDLGWLQGRYPERGIGDSFCRFRRDAAKANAIRQTIRSLQPGRTYSLKFYAADMGRLDTRAPVAVGVEITGAEILPEYAIEFVYPSCYSHTSGPYTADHPAWFTWRRIVFVPAKDTAELTLRDWRTVSDPGGPAGQEIGVNFIEVQPFHKP